MLLKTAAIAFVCVATTSFTTIADAKQTKYLNQTEFNQHYNIFIKEWTLYFDNLKNTKQDRYSNSLLSKNDNYLPINLAINSNQTSYMKLLTSGTTNKLGNPIYILNFYVNGQLIKTYQTVTGRVHTQHRNRHKSGTEAPLPDGRYKVAKTPVPGTIREAGNLFLPIQPLFQTNRSALGIHYDPSFEKDNGEDGTSGCIGLKSQAELNEFLNDVRQYQPRYLTVDIQ